MTGKSIMNFTFKCALFCFSLLAFNIKSFAGEKYDITMILSVPRVYDNAQSLGYRKYQTQRIRGTLYVDENEAEICGLYNRTHRINGKYVTYDCIVDSFQWALVGNNKTGRFRCPSVNLSFEALPSYMSGYEPTDDNSLVLNLSGSGLNPNYIHGSVSGTLGCGCADYGHISPTRSYFTCDVLDRAAVWGTFKLKRK